MTTQLPSPWRSAEERDQDRSQKREAVLQAAVRSFNENGFRATSLEEIAATLGVSKPTLYHYFAGKDDILFECARRGLEDIREAAAAVERTGGSACQRLEALMRGYAMVMTQDFGMCVIRVPDHELAPEVRRRLRDLKREIDLTVRRVVEEGVRDGSLVAGDPQLATFAIAGALNWIARWYDPFGARAPEEIAAGMASMLMSGMLPRPAGGGEERMSQ